MNLVEQKEDSKEPLVSVIIPARNLDDYLDQSLESIILQTYINLEIIIVVDQEDLNLFKSKYKNEKRRIIKVIGSNIRGLGPALNSALEVSNGDYIARMDADDLAHPERIKKQIDLLVTQPKIDVVTTNAYIIDELGKNYNKKFIINNYTNEQISRILNIKNIIIHPSVLIRASAIKKIGGYSAISSEDFDVWHRILQNNPRSITMIDECLLYYRIHKNQLSYLTRKKSHRAVCVVLFNKLLTSFSLITLIGLCINLFKLIIYKKK